jgi:hypothetical protein
MKRLLCRVMLIIAFVSRAWSAQAWSSHALCTWQALGVMSELDHRLVKAESLEAFLAAEAPRLHTLLQDQEEWSRAHLTGYRPRPNALEFVVRAAGTAPNGGMSLRARFLQAVRLNPNSQLRLFVQSQPGDVGHGRPCMPWAGVTPTGRRTAASEGNCVMLDDGEAVSALDVAASASAEPDDALDIGLWADSGTEYGTRFGFGLQPFGNAAVESSSQAPFHMGFFHESPIISVAAGYLKRSHVEYRVHLFMTLASHAFATRHPYWGWRFTGWALHYVQDMTQPYHARMLPGVSVARMMAINALGVMGFPRSKDDAVTLVTNRHWVLEGYQRYRLRQAYEGGDTSDPLVRALRQTAGDSAHRLYRQESLREVVSAEAADIADEVDRALERAFAPRYTSDPSVILSNSSKPVDMQTLAQQMTRADRTVLEADLSTLMNRFGRHSRALVRAVLEQATR